MRIKLLLACLICTSMMSQALKKKKKSGISYQELYTIDKNSKERHGYYLKFSKFSKDTLVKGMFEQGKKVGVWSFMGKKNSIYLKYDYEQRELIQNIEETLERDSILVKLGNEFKLKSAVNFNIESAFNEKINKTVLNSVERIRYGWVPATINGALVVSKMYMMLNFNFFLKPNLVLKSKFEDKVDLIVINLTYLGIEQEKKL